MPAANPIRKWFAKIGIAVRLSASPVGVSEAIVLEDKQGENIEVEWRFEMPQQTAAVQATRNTKAIAK